MMQDNDLSRYVNSPKKKDAPKLYFRVLELKTNPLIVFRTNVLLLIYNYYVFHHIADEAYPPSEVAQNLLSRALINDCSQHLKMNIDY